MVVKKPQELFIIYKTSDKENKNQGKKTWHIDGNKHKAFIYV